MAHIQLADTSCIILTVIYMGKSDFDSHDFYDTIRKNIKKYRSAKGMTAAALSEKAGLGHDYLRQIESEQDRHHVSLISLYKISLALEVTIDQLIRPD